MERSHQSQLCVRPAFATDRSRILEISSQIWGGDDYVPELLETWYSDDEGELVVATWENRVIAFAHRTWLCPEIAWFEGIRAEPASQGHGAGRAITEYLIEAARRAGASRIALSTYVDNRASIHIIESYGFQRVATFSFLQRPDRAAVIQDTTMSPEIHPVSEQDTIRYVAQSEFLGLARGRFPRGWRFFPFAHDPEEAVARLEHRFGTWNEDGLTALLCIRQGADHEGAAIIYFLDGEPSGMQALLDHAFRTYAGRGFEIMVPAYQGRSAAAMPLLQTSGFESWRDFEPDMFAYELDL